MCPFFNQSTLKCRISPSDITRSSGEIESYCRGNYKNCGNYEAHLRGDYNKIYDR